MSLLLQFSLVLCGMACVVAWCLILSSSFFCACVCVCACAGRSVIGLAGSPGVWVHHAVCEGGQRGGQLGHEGKAALHILGTNADCTKYLVESSIFSGAETKRRASSLGALPPPLPHCVRGTPSMMLLTLVTKHH